MKAIAYDQSRSARDLRLVCAGCAGGRDRREGVPIYAGDEWGHIGPRGPAAGRCQRCGRVPDGLVIVDAR